MTRTIAEQEAEINAVQRSMRNIAPARISLQTMRGMSDDELLKFISGEDGRDGTVYLPMQQTVMAELMQRQMARSRKPHRATFALLIVSVVLAAVGVAVTLLGLPDDRRPFARQQQPAATNATSVASPPPIPSR